MGVSEDEEPRNSFTGAIMKSWLTEYSAALDARDAREKAQIRFINACMKLKDRYLRTSTEFYPSDTRLADRTATLEAANTVSVLTTEPPPAPSPTQRTTSPGLALPFRGKSSPSSAPGDSTDASPSDALSRLRADLASTQRSRAALQSQLAPLSAQLATLQAQTSRDAKLITVLSREKSLLERRVKDRDEEIKGKARLVEEVQDEMLSLNLQLNMAEQKSEKLQAENKQLVDRWMERMGREVEQMNERSKWT